MKKARAVGAIQRIVKHLGLSSLGMGIRQMASVAAEQMQVPLPIRRDQQRALIITFHDHLFPDKALRPPTKPQVPKPVQPKPQPRMVQAPKKKPNTVWEVSDAFLGSFEWRQLRMRVLVKRGARCECCGATPQKNGIVLNVDHIKPRRKYPELALTESNLQVLCEVCNHGKGSWDQTDWRTDSQHSGESYTESPVTRSGDGRGHVPVIDSSPAPQSEQSEKGEIEQRDENAMCTD